MIQIKKSLRWSYVLILIIFLLSNIDATSCPYNLEKDQYPGSCGLYIDSNNDNNCDLSTSSTITKEIASFKQQPKSENIFIGKDYWLLSITIITCLLYFGSIYLSKKGKFTIITLRKFWNIVLLISFILAGLSGILLVLRLSYGFNPTIPFNMLFWHVETGIVMTIVSIFHISWHLPYFKSLLNIKRK